MATRKTKPKEEIIEAQAEEVETEVVQEEVQETPIEEVQEEVQEIAEETEEIQEVEEALIEEEVEEVEETLIEEAEETEEALIEAETEEAQEEIEEVKTEEIQTVEAEPVVPAPTKKRIPLKYIIAGAIGFAVVLVALIAIFSSICAKADTSLGYAIIDEAGDAYIPLENGKLLKIDENEKITEAYITPNRKKIVVCMQNGVIYSTNKDLLQKNYISELDNYTNIIVTDDGVIFSAVEYRNTENEKISLFRYLFSKNEKMTITSDKTAPNYVKAYDNLTVMYKVGDSIFVLSQKQDEAQKIAEAKGANIVYISENGENAIYSTLNEGKFEICFYDDEETLTVATFEKQTSSHKLKVQHTEDRKLFVITDASSDYLYIVERGDDEDDIRKALVGKNFANFIYTENGTIDKSSAGDCDEFYTLINNDLYYFDSDCERERVISDVKQIDIKDGEIYFINDENNFCRGKLDEDEIKKQEKITSDVAIMYSAEFAESLGIEAEDYLYLSKFGADGNVNLYCYKYGASKAVKIGEDADPTILPAKANEKGIYYFKDVEMITGAMTEKATLMYCEYGDKEPTEIAKDVICDMYLFQTGNFTKESGGMIFYQKYETVNSNGDLVVDFVFADGDDIEVVANDIVVK